MSAVVRDVPTAGGPARAHVWRPARSVATRGSVVLGHGAGGGVDALDLQALAARLPAQGWVVALVEQPWRVAGRRVAGPPAGLDRAWLQVVPALLTGRARLPRPLVLGGRSAGARVACRTAAALDAAAVLALSFPLHPPGKSGSSRAGELALVTGSGRPLGVVQGERDPFGTPAELAPYAPVVFAVAGTHMFPAASVGRVAQAAVEFLCAADFGSARPG